MDIRDRRLKARLSKWSTCSVETKRGLVKPRKVIMFKRFLSYYEPQMGLFVADTVCALVLAAIDLAFPIILDLFPLQIHKVIFHIQAKPLSL